MIMEKDFILTIRLYPELYRKIGVLEEKKKQELWAQLAQENHLKSGGAAETKWRQLVSKYVSYLVYGTPFAYEREMQFMQMHLLGSEDTQSDSDIDEVELNKILNSYEDSPPIIKSQCNGAVEDKVESPNQHMHKEHKNDEYNVSKKRGRTIGTNATAKRGCEPYNNTNEMQSITSGKTKDMVHEVTKSPESNPLFTETESDDCVMLPALTIQPASVLANVSSEETGMYSSFTNLTSLELIFLGYAKVLQRMPLRLQLQTKRKIADIMDEVELKLLEEN